VYDSPDSLYAFGREFLFGLHMNEHFGYLRQLLQHSGLKQMGSAVSIAY
jgi:hypothetical protein